MDDKLTVFMDEFTKHFESQIKVIKIESSDKMTESSSQNNEFKNLISENMKTLEGITSNNNEGTLTRLKQLEEKVNAINIEDFNHSLDFNSNLLNERNLEELNNYKTSLLKETDEKNLDLSLKIEQLNRKIHGINQDLQDTRHKYLKENTAELRKNISPSNSSQSFIDQSQTYSSSQGTFVATEKSPSDMSNENLELLMFFDSNGRYIDRRKLWKMNNSIFRRCGTIQEVANSIKNEKSIKSTKYILLHVGVNDIDHKDNEQVLDEMIQLVEEIGIKYPGIKFIISEITPRNDE